MGFLDLDPEKQKKYDELKKLYQKKPQIQIPEKQLQSEQWGLMISPDHSITSEHFNQN